MKYVAFLTFLCISHFLFGQEPSASEQLKQEEKILLQLEQVIQNRETTLGSQGIEPNSDPQLVAMRKEYKKQKKIVKKLARKAKKEENARELPNINNIDQLGQNQKANSVNQGIRDWKKDRLKELKTQQNKLLKQRRDAIKDAEKRGINPTQDRQVQQLEQQINTLSQAMEGINSGRILPRDATNGEVKSIANANSATENSQSSSFPNVHEQTNTNHNVVPLIGVSTILFPKYVTDVPHDYELYLNYVANQLQNYPNLMLKIEAYTDNSEKKKVEFQITSAMANSVAQEFVNRGINANRLLVSSNGAKNAVGDNDTFFGQTRNRRVELAFVTQ